jgi:hypothetical protein
MSLTIDQLRNGINYWRLEKFPPDFHNTYYERDLLAAGANGVFNQQWWSRFLPVLQDWQAIRPRSHAFLTSRAQARFAALSKIWGTAVAPYLDNDIAGVEWHQVAAFPSLVAEIKSVASPVFTSKFCHFLAPRIFPVTDNKLVNLPFRTYEEHFTASRKEWLDTDSATQDELVRQLIHEIGAPLFSGFPMKCKLIELCMIGRRHG